MSASPDRLLYHTPGACSRVALNALEEIGLPYRAATVALNRGAQYAPDYLAINPKGKIPVLVEGDTITTELPVILYRLATAHPDAGLLPSGLAPLSDLIWIAGVLHPTAARLFRPDAVSSSDPAAVKAVAMEQLSRHAAMVSARLNSGGWWYGDRWSITDTFLAWVFGLAATFGFPLSRFPELETLRANAEARPSFKRARAFEIAAAARDDLVMPPGLEL